MGDRVTSDRPPVTFFFLSLPLVKTAPFSSLLYFLNLKILFPTRKTVSVAYSALRLILSILDP